MLKRFAAVKTNQRYAAPVSVLEMCVYQGKSRTWVANPLSSS